MEDVNPISIDTETWGNQELTQVIASRYFILGQETNQQSSWEISYLSEIDAANSLSLLNNHIESLGLIGVLSNDIIPVLSIIPLPSSSSVSSRWQQILIWSLMSIFLTIVGAEWFGRYDQNKGILNSDNIQESLFYFTIPIIFTLLLCSHLRYWIAKHNSVDSGHIIPIIFPILYPMWPFGLTGILSQKRMDNIPFPDRKKLAIIESILPLSIFFIGSLFTIIGLKITSNEPPDLETSPIVFEVNQITQIIYSSLFDDIELKLQWLHPIGIAGLGLSMIAWILLLPIPGFPGDRLLYSLFGPSEMSKGELQTSLFISSLTIMIIIFAFVNYLPWLFLVAFATWQRFSPENNIIPFVVNQNIDLSNDSKSKITIVLVSILILGFPGFSPISDLEDYDSGLSTSDWPEDAEIPQFGEASLDFLLQPNGIMPVSGFLQFSIEGSQSEYWEINSSCGKNKICYFSNVTQNSNQLINIVVKAPNFIFEEKMYLRIVIDVNENEKEHLILLYNDQYSGPKNVFWIISNNSNNPIICTKINIISGDRGNLSLTNPFWNFENSSFMKEGINDLCLIGHEGALFSSNSTDEQFRQYGPSVQFNRENNTTLEWWMPIENTEPNILISGTEWTIPPWINLENTQYSIVYGSDNPVFCKSSDIVTEVNANWTLPLEEYTPIKFSKGPIINGTIIVPSTGWLMICNESTPVSKYIIKEGLDVIINQGSINNKIITNSFSIINRENFSIPISVEWYGDSVNYGAWGVQNIPGFVGPNEEVEITMEEKVDSSLYYSSWISIDQDTLTIHISVRCPSYGCS